MKRQKIISQIENAIDFYTTALAEAETDLWRQHCRSSLDILTTVHWKLIK